MGKIMSPCTQGACSVNMCNGDQPMEHVLTKTFETDNKGSNSRNSFDSDVDMALEMKIKSLDPFDYGTPVNDDVKVEDRKQVELEGGIRYTGQWIKGTKIRHGKGVQRLRDGTMYEGWWKDNMANGRGRYLDAKGLYYEGMWKDNMKNGDGIFKWPDGRVYQGNFENNAFTGYGKLTWPNGQTYKGNWKDSQMEGQGVYMWPDGRIYDGAFKEGK